VDDDPRLVVVVPVSSRAGDLLGHVARSRIELCHGTRSKVVDATYLGRAFSRVARGSPGSVICDQYSAKSSSVRRPSRKASAALR
jgi:hypothetical protein